jgi:adenine phosphoribosyltransferase
MELHELAETIRNVPDFPKPGIQFKDISTLVMRPDAFREVIARLIKRYEGAGLDAIVGIDARGFIFGGTLAYEMRLPFVMARKKGKLPADTICETFQLEYGTDTLEIHRDALQPGQKVIIVDDLLATGGTVAAVARMVRRLEAEVVEAAFVVELPPLNGRKNLGAMDIQVFSLVEFMVD